MNAAAYIAAIAAVCATTEAASGSGQPGYCKNDDSCEDNYVCISVQTTRSGIEDVKQCLPYEREGDVCSGTFPGLCPSFSTWKTAFQSISSVCAYQLPSGTDQCLNDSTSDSETSGFVSCIEMTAGSGSEAVSAGMIIGCVDFDGSDLLFDEKSENFALSGEMNYTAVINEGCVNPNNAKDSDVVCSGRGTCTPNSPGSRQFNCECNVGYNGTYCQGIESNKCTLESQCQAGTCNLKTQQCECEEGTTGDQCAFCDPSSSKACNGRGTCVAAPSNTPASGTSASGTPASGTPATNTSASGTSATNTSASGTSASGTQASGTSTSGTSTSGTSTSGTSTSGTSTSGTSVSSNRATGTSTSNTSPSGTSASEMLASNDAESQLMTGSGNADTVLVGTNDQDAESVRFLQTVGANATSSRPMVCECEDGYAGDQCSRRVDTGSNEGRNTNRRSNSPASDATSLVTSIALVAVVFVIALV